MSQITSDAQRELEAAQAHLKDASQRVGVAFREWQNAHCQWCQDYGDQVSPYPIDRTDPRSDRLAKAKDACRAAEKALHAARERMLRGTTTSQHA